MGIRSGQRLCDLLRLLAGLLDLGGELAELLPGLTDLPGEPVQALACSGHRDAEHLALAPELRAAEHDSTYDAGCRRKGRGRERDGHRLGGALAGLGYLACLLLDRVARVVAFRAGGLLAAASPVGARRLRARAARGRLLPRGAASPA